MFGQFACFRLHFFVAVKHEGILNSNQIVRKVAIRSVLGKNAALSRNTKFITNCPVTVPTNVLSTFVCVTCAIIFLTYSIVSYRII